MAFSAALALTDLNDFLGPSQECIKPVSVKEDLSEKKEKDVGAAATEIMIDHSSNAYYEVDASGTTSSSGESQKLKKAEITLNDCLACSGCVTSAESVLVAMQSHEEVYKVLSEQPDLTPILSISPQSVASLAALHSVPPSICLQKLRRFFRQQMGFRLVFDTTFARHMSLLEGQEEFYEKAPSYKGKEREIPTDSKSFPLLASACPGWICYAEKTHGELLPFLSNVKSPQQIMGTLVKEWLAPQLGLSREQIYHVAVMPCYDKKLEASRPDFATEDGNRDVDCVLTTGEVQKILNDKDIDLGKVEATENSPEDTYMPSLLSQPGSASGGYLHNAITAAVKAQAEANLRTMRLVVKPIRGEDYVEYLLYTGSSILFRGARCYGFRNLQNVVRKVGREAGVTVTKGAAGKNTTRRGGMMKRAARLGASEEPEHGFDFIEVMACPSGCVNGGGQIAPPKHPIPVEVDREGMPVVSDDAGEYKMVIDPVDGHRVLSGKEWVARVEEFYWQLGARRTSTSEDYAPSARDVDVSLRPYLEPLGPQAEYTMAAERIISEMVAKHMQPEGERKRILRTQYRAIESEEVNGLAVKW